MNPTAFAYEKSSEQDSQQYKKEFTEETKENIEFIHSLVLNNVITVENGQYLIDETSEGIKSLEDATLMKLKENISLYNEGIQLGLFEINEEMYLESSENYENIRSPLMITRNTMIIPLDSILKTNGNTMYRVWYMNNQTYGPNIGMIETGLYFASKVKTGGDWDYKRQLGTQTIYIAEVDGKSINMTGEFIGNANYGYAGRKVFGASLLRTAAGAYQIYSGTSHGSWYSTYFDDPNDQYWINRGISYSEGGRF